MADPTALHEGAEELSPEERARRERMREGSAGIVGLLHRRRASTVAAFALSGGLYAVDLVAGSPRVRALDVPGPGHRPAALARRRARRLRLAAARCASSRADGTERPGRWPSRRTTLETCGLVDFVAAEELDRSRGFWWSPDSDAAARRAGRRDPGAAVVDRRPGAPRAAPAPAPLPRRRHRQRRRVAVARRASTAPPTAVAWDHDGVPLPRRRRVAAGYGDPLLVVMTRDQQRPARCSRSTPATGRTTRRRPRSTTTRGSTPRPAPRAGRPTAGCSRCAPTTRRDTYRLHLGDGWLTPGRPAGARRGRRRRRRRARRHARPTRSRAARARRLGRHASRRWRRTTGWHHRRAARRRHRRRSCSRTLESHRRRVTRVRSAAAHDAVTSYAERPVGDAAWSRCSRPASARSAPRCCSRRDHVPGSRRLPVLLSPYGGPHHQEVVAVGRARSARTSGSPTRASASSWPTAAARRAAGRRGSARCYRDLADAVLEDQVAALDAVAEALARRRRHRPRRASAAGRSAATSPRSRCCAAPTSSTPPSPARR